MMFFAIELIVMYAKMLPLNLLYMVLPNNGKVSAVEFHPSFLISLLSSGWPEIQLIALQVSPH